MFDIDNSIVLAIFRMTANNNNFSAHGEWWSNFRNRLFEECELIECGIGYHMDIDNTENSEEYYLKYLCFKQVDCLIQSMNEFENLSAWRFMGLEWSDEYNTQHLKEASQTIVSYFEKPEFFPQKKDKIVELIDVLLKYKCGYDLRDIEGQYIKYNHQLNEFYCTDNMKKIKWYDLVSIITLPDAKLLIPQDMQKILDEFHLLELSSHLTISL